MLRFSESQASPILWLTSETAHSIDALEIMFHRYLEDVIPLLNYRPSAMKRGKNTNDSQPNQDEYVAQGLDNQTIQTIQAISKSDRIDFQVCPIFQLPG